MTDSRKRPPRHPARDRAFEIFKASGGKMAVFDIMRHLEDEGFLIARNQVDTWKLRDKWVENCPPTSTGQGLIGLQQALIRPKMEAITELNQVEMVGEACVDIIHTMTKLASTVRARVDQIEPKDIEVKHVAPIIKSLTTLLALSAGLETEVMRRKAELAKEIILEPDKPATDDDIHPAARAALNWVEEQKRKGNAK